MNQAVFSFSPAQWLPYRDKEVLQAARIADMQDMEQHKWENDDFHLQVVPDAEAQFIIDFFQRIRNSDSKDERLTVILPGPRASVWENVALLCNKYLVSCRNLEVFFQTEWADQDGKVAPLSYKASYGRLFQKYFLANLNEELRPAEEQIHYWTSDLVSSYSDLIDERGEGGADVCYLSPGWSGRIAAIEPEGEFVCASLEEYLAQPSRISTNYIMSVAEDSLLGLFGHSGDMAAVPPKSASIGPRDVARARRRLILCDQTPLGGQVSWQCIGTRLMLFGPVSMAIPASIVRLYPGNCFVTEPVAKAILTAPPIPDEVTFAGQVIK